MERPPKSRPERKPRGVRRSGENGSIASALAMRRADAAFFGGYRIGLLEAIEQYGSISGAARAVGISYKTAWDAVDGMNNASERVLVVRTAGGRGGGGTMLTEDGKETVRMYRVLQGEHRKFMRRLEEKLGDPGKFHRLFRRVAMRVSARNVLFGKVSEVRKGAVNSEVLLALKGGEPLCAVITNQSVDALGLKPGVEAYAIVKASSVILGRDLHGAKVSARNVLCGTVDRILHGPVNAEVSVILPGGSVLAAVVTEESVKSLAFAKGEHACALVKASNVIIAVDA